MAEALAAAASIAGIVGFGLQLATTLLTYVESVMEAEERLRDVAFDVNSTASALKQLQEIIDTDGVATNTDQTPRVFKDEGLKEIEVMAVECEKVYTSIVVFVSKAGTGGGKGKVSSTSVDVRALKAFSLSRNLKWPWLEPRIKRCQDKLRWLKMNLLFNLQLASLARLQIRTTERLPGSFDEELAVRAMAQQLRQRRIRYAEKFASKVKKEDETKSLLETDTVSSVHSAPGVPSEDAYSRPKAEDDSKEDEVKSLFGDTGQNPDSPEKPEINSSVNLMSTNRNIDEEKDPFPFDDIPELGSDKKDELPKDLNDIPQPASVLTESDTLNHNAEKEKPYQATVEDMIEEEIIVEDKVRPPSPAQPKIEVPQDKLSSKAPSTKPTEVLVDDESESLKQDDKKPEFLSLPIYEQNSGLTPSWLKRLFGNRDKFLHDWESQVLEAFIVHKDPQPLVKLPFGHKRLTYGLKQVIKKGDFLSWEQYLALGAQHHRAIDRIVAEAQQVDSRQRTFLALTKKTGPDGDRLIVFFSLNGLGEAAQLMDSMDRKLGFSFGRDRTWELRTRIVEAELARLRAEGEKPTKEEEQAKIDKKKAIKFKDAVGRKFTFPFHNCKTWAGMEELIRQAFLHVDVIGPHVAEGHYDLVGPNGEIILPQVWESIIEPAWAITMHMWPLPEPPRPVPDGVHVIDVGPRRPGGARRRGPPPPPPNWIGPPPGGVHTADVGVGSAAVGVRGPPPGPPPGWIGPSHGGDGVHANGGAARQEPERTRGPHSPPGWIGPRLGARMGGRRSVSREGDVIVIGDKPTMKSPKKKAFKRRSIFYNSDDSESSDSDKLPSDSEIEDDPEAELGIEIDFQKEEEKAKIPLRELLGKWTNATDTGDQYIPDTITGGGEESDSDSCSWRNIFCD